MIDLYDLREEISDMIRRDTWSAFAADFAALAAIAAVAVATLIFF